MELSPLTEYTADQLGAGVSVDGPCLMRDGTFALFVSLRGKDGGAMPSPAELHWGRDVPDRMRAEAVHLFLRKDREERSATYLGRVTYVKRGLFRLSEPLAEPAWRELVVAAQAPPPPPPEEAIAALTTESTTDDRVQALRVFVERWYGEAPEAIAPTIDVPSPLREIHRLASKRKLFGQNRLVPANELVAEDGRMIFYIENQGVCVWAIDPTLDDPPVFARGNGGDEPWVLEAPTLSGFLIQAVLFETIVCAAYFGASTDGGSPAELRKIRRHVAPLVLPPWAWNKTEFFASNGIIGFAYVEGDALHIELAAHDREPFEAIEDVIAEWPNIGF